MRVVLIQDKREQVYEGELVEDTAPSAAAYQSRGQLVGLRATPAHLRHPPPRATRETDRQPPVDRDPASDLAVDRPG